MRLHLRGVGEGEVPPARPAVISGQLARARRGESLPRRGRGGTGVLRAAYSAASPRTCARAASRAGIREFRAVQNMWDVYNLCNAFFLN